jgi:sigma-B regulation protein RsbU (phosphoserine phosphatase)
MTLRLSQINAIRILAVLFLLTLSYQFRVSWDIASRLLNPQGAVSDPFTLALPGNRVATVSDAARSAGVHPGDTVTAINGHPYSGLSTSAQALRQTRPGGFLRLSLERGGVRRDIAIQLAAEQPRGWGRAAFEFLLRVLTPLLCVALGYLVAFQRPFDPLAWLVLALMLSFAHTAGASDVTYAWEAGIRPAAVLFSEAWSNSWPIWMCLFGVYFPEQITFRKRFKWVLWAAVAPAAIWMAVVSVVSVLAVESWRAAVSWTAIARVMAPFVFFIYAVPISFFFWNLGYKTGKLPSLDSRRRIRLLLWGSAISLTPLFLGHLIAIFRRTTLDSLPEWYTIPALLLLSLFPVTMAYVIVVQHAMDVRMALRQGLRYTLARGSMTAVRVLLVIAMIAYMVDAANHSSMNQPRTVIVIAGGTAAILLLRRAADRASLWLDRKFFREAYNSEHILADLSEKVRTIVETRPLLETVGRQLSDSLHVSKLAMLLRDGDCYEPAYARGFDQPPPVRIPVRSDVISTLRKEGGPLPVFADNPNCWVHTLRREETEMLLRLEPELVLPLAVKEEIHGFISLGGKQSEEPYSSTDLKLLRSVAIQTGLALENSRLTAAVANEVAQRERLNRELEIAREVQQRLFPQVFPPVEGLEYAGACRPAQGVGGDYYDFIPVPNGHFGIAIGDVSGKGIPAALLMASLQACLRSQAISAPPDLAGLMGNMNRLIFDASPSNKYATFFYAQYDPRSRLLTYVNGGHNAPMLFRNGEVIRLEEGGPVVGLFRAAGYRQASLPLMPGDILVAFTDGVSEAMNIADEEFGEERMTATVRECRAAAASAGSGSVTAATGTSPSAMIDRLMSAADAFAGAAPQHDDMTLVVVRVV